MTFTANAGKTQTVPFTVQFFALGRGRGDAAMYGVGPGTGVAAAPSCRAFGKVLAGRLAAAKL